MGTLCYLQCVCSIVLQTVPCAIIFLKLLFIVFLDSYVLFMKKLFYLRLLISISSFVIKNIVNF